MLHRISSLEVFLGMTKAKESGYEIWNMESQDSVKDRIFENSIKRMSRK
jgi:hypothetical protein